MLEPNPFAVLGLAPNAGAAAAAQRYRRLAKLYHPDAANGGNVERFLEIQKAYDALRRRFEARSPSHRRERTAPYARTQAPQSGQTQETEADSAGETSGGIERYRLRIDLELASEGGTRMIRLRDGRRASLRIPKGAKAGTVMRLRPAETAGHQVRAEAQLTLEIKPHTEFRRHGDDIHAELRLPWITALLGGQITAQTVRGRVRVTVPAGARSGMILRLSGAGFAGQGAHCARIRVDAPEWVRAAMRAASQIAPAFAPERYAALADLRRR